MCTIKVGGSRKRSKNRGTREWILVITFQLYITPKNSPLWSWASKQTMTFVLLDHSQILGYACISINHEHHTNLNIFCPFWDKPDVHEKVDNKHLDYFWNAQPWILVVPPNCQVYYDITWKHAWCKQQSFLCRIPIHISS